MTRLAVLCISIPFRIFFLGLIIGLGVFYVYEAFVPKDNPQYDGWDAWFLYWVLAGFSLLLSCVLSCAVFFNFSKQIRECKSVNKATFFVPIIALFFPLVFLFYSTLYVIYLLVPFCVFLLQYYHYWRFMKNEKAGVYKVKA